MKISDVKAVYPDYAHALAGWRPELWQIIVRVRTDTGLVGWGSGGAGRAALPIVNGHFRELLTGRELGSTADISNIWDDLYHASIPYGRKGVALMALSGVDLALWDVLARAEGKPVYELAGGLTRQRVRAYATGTRWQEFAEAGYTAIKLNHRHSNSDDLEQFVGMFAEVRKSLGEDIDLMTDCYMSWDEETAFSVAKSIGPYRPYFIEDVCTPDELEAQARIRTAVKPALLAGGEHEFSQHGFAELARSGALDIWQPDITWCGGFTAGLRIMDIAEEAGVEVIPHRGGEAWGLHLILSTACGDFAEFNANQRALGDTAVWEHEPKVVDGYMSAPDGVGFGVEPQESSR